MDKKQKIYFRLSIFIVLTALMLSYFYRPYIYKNHINDFGFADTIGSLASVIGICFLFWGLKKYSNRDKNKHIIMATFVYTFFWESLGIIGIHGTFDWKDIIAGFISGGITFLLKEIIEKRIPEHRKITITKE